LLVHTHKRVTDPEERKDAVGREREGAYAERKNTEGWGGDPLIIF